jgi:hypothetical protein
MDVISDQSYPKKQKTKQAADKDVSEAMSIDEQINQFAEIIVEILLKDLAYDEKK